MNTIKTILISAAVFLLLSWIPAHPILACLAAYITLNCLSFCAYEIANDNFKSFGQICADIYKREGFHILLLLLLLGFFAITMIVIGGSPSFRELWYKNWKYLFKTEPPTIKFQSPIVIEKAVDSGGE